MLIRFAALAAMVGFCLMGAAETASAPAEKSWVEIKEEAANEAVKATDEMTAVEEQLRKVQDDAENKLMDASIKAWVAYRDAQSEYEASYTGAGTDHAVNYPNVATHLTRLRIAELKAVLKERSVGK